MITEIQRRMTTMTNYRYNITITEDGKTYTGNYYFIDHIEAADFLDEK